MFMNYNLKKLRNLAIGFHAFIIVLTPMLYLILDEPFDARFWIIYVVFIIMLPALFLFFWIKMASTTKPYTEEKLTLVTPLGKHELQQRIQQISIEKKWKILEEKPDMYVLVTPVTWKSLGEIITLYRDVRLGEIHMSSRPKVISTRIDYRKNRQNLEYLIEKLQS